MRKKLDLDKRKKDTKLTTKSKNKGTEKKIRSKFECYHSNKDTCLYGNTILWLFTITMTDFYNKNIKINNNNKTT